MTELHAQANLAWRDPAAVVMWDEARAATERELLRSRTRGPFWEVLAERQLTVFVTREYENMVVALSTIEGRPHATYQALPHPSGMVFDRVRQRLYVAATRNPNQVVSFAPLAGLSVRRDVAARTVVGRPLMPVSSAFFPGHLYLHDLAFVNGELHGNAVGENAVVRFDVDGPRRVWWPLSIEREDGPDFSANYLQLNSIAAGADLESSFFSASTDRLGRTRPGALNFRVDKRGVVFGGATREPVITGLTRPHSARLRGGEVWVANSGYGELGVGVDGRFQPQLKLSGWTRGLCFDGDLAILGTSRVIPRFSHYAPGLDPSISECGVHLVDVASAKVVASLVWPLGNQIFAVETVPSEVTTGFADKIAGGTPKARLKRLAELYYSFELEETANT
jgi:uncharacterized protein (TIGR03032 family)